MPLNDLDQPELERLIEALLKVGEATQPLHRDGLNPRIDLTPGNEVRITLGYTMPEAPVRHVVASYLIAPEPAINGFEATTPSIEAAPDLTQSGDVGAAPPEPLDAPSTAGEGVEGAPVSAGPSRSDDDPAPDCKVGAAGADVTPPRLAEATSDEAAAESGGGVVMAAAEPPAAPVPGSASALAASTLNSFGPIAWTDEEDARLIGLVVAGMVGQSLPKLFAIRAAATELGRGEGGTKSRCYGKLKDRLDRALAEAIAAKADAEAILTQSPPSRPSGRAAAPSGSARRKRGAARGDAPASVPEPGAGAPTHVASPITAHIMTLPTKGGWSLGHDLELMELSIEGWQPNEIALQLKIQASEIKPRFDLLTGLFEDEATGKKVRRFRRKDVLEALKSLTAGKAA